MKTKRDERSTAHDQMSCQRHVFEAAFEAFLQGSDTLSKQQWEDLAPAKAKILVVQESENWVPRKPSKPPWFIIGIFLVCHLRIFKGVSMSIPFLRQTMTNPWDIFWHSSNLGRPLMTNQPVCVVFFTSRVEMMLKSLQQPLADLSIWTI